MVSVGMLGSGVCLPDEVRQNSWWPPETVAGWRERFSKSVGRPERPGSSSVGEQISTVLSEISADSRDPFRGVRERRVKPASMRASDMEVAAAKDAMTAAGVGPDDIDFLLGSSFVPDYLTVPNVCIVHKKLGLKQRCTSLTVDVVCNSFLAQMSLARSMIATGAGRCGLLIQSSTFSDLIPTSEPFSAFVSDAATAQVVAAVEEGFGILAASHHTDGTCYDAMVASVPGKRWFEEGRVEWYPENLSHARLMLHCIIDRGAASFSDTLAACDLEASDVTFYAGHQATRWVRPLMQEAAGFDGARYMDTFAWTGSLGACNVPVQLHIAEREGLLRRSDVAALLSGGSGDTWSTMVVRWSPCGHT